MDRIDLFRIFIHVVDASSFTRAADALGMPRSTVSAAIQELETRVGARLLHRTTRKVSPTLDGEAFYEKCLRLVADVEETETLFRQTRTQPTGKLHINVPGRIGRLVIAPALPDFFGRYPGIEIILGVTDRVVHLIEDSVDCVLRVGPLEDSTLIARSFGELSVINVASPAYLAQSGTPMTPADLPAHRAVQYASPTSGRTEAWEWVEDGRVHSLPMAGRVTVNSAEAYIACCLAGLGLIQIPAYDVQHHIAAGELVEVLPGYRAEPMPLTLLYPHRQHLSLRLKVFADWLEELVHEHLLHLPPGT